MSMSAMIDPVREWFLSLGYFGTVAWIVLKILTIAMPVIIAVAFYVVWERKLIGWMHVRHGPMYVGKGVLQAFADVFKLLFKEVIQPTRAHPVLYWLAPLIALAPAFAAWAVVPFDARLVLSNANAGLLYLLAMTSLGVYGIILAGWASNSKYAFLGAMRAAAQVVSYEIAMGFALVAVMVGAGSLNLSEIVMAQAGDAGLFEWFLWPMLPLFVVYFVTRWSDRHHERRRLTVASLYTVFGVCVCLSAHGSPIFAIAALSIGASTYLSGTPIFYAFLSERLSGLGIATGIALVNSIGNLGGFVAPSLRTYVEQNNGGSAAGLYTLGGAALLAALMLALMPRGWRTVIAAPREASRPGTALEGSALPRA